MAFIDCRLLYLASPYFRDADFELGPLDYLGLDYYLLGLDLSLLGLEAFLLKSSGCLKGFCLGDDLTLTPTSEDPAFDCISCIEYEFEFILFLAKF